MSFLELLPWLALKRIFKYTDIDSCINLHGIIEIPENMWRKKIEKWYGIKPEELIISWEEIFKNHMLACIYAGVEINTKNKGGNTVLHITSRKGKKEIVELLINIEGIEINTTNESGDTALHYALMNGHKEIVKLLIDKEIDINAKNYTGWTALHLASINGHKKIAELLIDRGIEINTKDIYGNTALYYSIRKSKEIEELLKSKGAI